MRGLGLGSVCIRHHLTAERGGVNCVILPVSAAMRGLSERSFLCSRSPPRFAALAKGIIIHRKRGQNGKATLRCLKNTSESESGFSEGELLPASSERRNPDAAACCRRDRQDSDNARPPGISIKLE